MNFKKVVVPMKKKVVSLKTRVARNLLKNIAKKSHPKKRNSKKRNSIKAKKQNIKNWISL